MWTNEQIKDHLQAARELLSIKDKIFKSLRLGASEFEVSNSIQEEFCKRNLVSTETPIVAFGKNTSHVHYFPKKKCSTLKQGDLILLDIWARLNKKNAPYADITWMAHYGKIIPKDIQKAFDTIISARNASVDLVKKNLILGKVPSGREIESAANNRIINNDYKKYIEHKTGHALGKYSPHGIQARICTANKKEIYKNLGYTIEPGIYLKNFGIRSEIDFYIDKNNKVVISAGMQKKIIII